MKTCWGKIELNDAILPRNYLGCLLHYFLLSFVFVSVDSLQPWLFQRSFQIDRKDQIENFKNAFVISLDIIVKLLCAPLFGYFADRFGRRNVNLYGVCIISATLMAMPYAPSFWFYVALRCVYATGKTQIT